MNNTVMIGALALLFAWGAWGIVLKLALQEIGLQTLIWGQVVSLLLFPFYFILFNDLLPLKFNTVGITWALVAGFLGLSGGVILNLLLRVAPANVAIPLSALYPAVTVVLAYFFLHEELSLTRVAGIGCAIAAIWLLTT